RVGVAPADAWFVGDHPENDVVGARRAGLTEVWVRHGRPWTAAEPAPARQIDRLGDLLDLVP
ncbi:MAG: HAD family hydrolase, partial [Phycisphaerae bacterium]